MFRCGFLKSATFPCKRGRSRRLLQHRHPSTLGSKTAIFCSCVYEYFYMIFPFSWPKMYLFNVFVRQICYFMIEVDYFSLLWAKCIRLEGKCLFTWIESPFFLRLLSIAARHFVSLCVLKSPQDWREPPDQKPLVKSKPAHFFSRHISTQPLVFSFSDCSCMDFLAPLPFCHTVFLPDVNFTGTIMLLLHNKWSFFW